MRYIAFISLTFALLLTACEEDKSWHEIKVANSFMISVPGYFKEDKKLREDAAFQYANRYRNVYVVVLEHEKTANQDLQQIDKMGMAPLLKYVDHAVITDSLHTKVNNLVAIQNKMYGSMPSGDDSEFVYYNHLSIEGKKKFYEVCTWTRGPKRKSVYDDDLTRILFSFKEQ